MGSIGSKLFPYCNAFLKATHITKETQAQPSTVTVGGDCVWALYRQQDVFIVIAMHSGICPNHCRACFSMHMQTSILSRYTVQQVIFEAFIFRKQPIQFLFAKSNFTNGDTEPRLLHISFFHNFNFRGLAVLSRNSRNINASKIIHYTVYKQGATSNSVLTSISVYALQCAESLQITKCLNRPYKIARATICNYVCLIHMKSKYCCTNNYQNVA